MPTRKELRDAEAALSAIWESQDNRRKRFPQALTRVSVTNIRGANLSVDLRWPLTVIGGVNGSGKTTFLQACSAAYVQDGGRRYPLGIWIHGALEGDTAPVRMPAAVSFQYDGISDSVAVKYSPEHTRWRYPRRGVPEKHVEFLGITLHAPRIEIRDRLHQHKARVRVLQSKVNKDSITESVSRILGTTYEETRIAKVGLEHNGWNYELAQAEKAGSTYNELHMGAGEQKILRMVYQLEGLPPCSLVLLEEPELTLHPDAQAALVWYLMRLIVRTGHQIIVATHSADIFETVPQEGRVLITRVNGSAQVLQSVPRLRAARQLTSDSMSGKDILFVEDDVAATFVRTLLRMRSATLLKNTVVVPVGNDNQVRKLTTDIVSTGLRSIGILDGDRAPGAAILMALPGGAPPEQVLLQPDVLHAAEECWSGIEAAFERARARGLTKPACDTSKAEMKALAEELSLQERELHTALVEAWVRSHPEEALSFVQLLEHKLDQLAAEAAGATNAPKRPAA
jgi:predicted ATPase